MDVLSYTKVESTIDPLSASDMLQNGWVLIAANPARGGGTVYVLGKRFFASLADVHKAVFK